MNISGATEMQIECIKEHIEQDFCILQSTLCKVSKKYS